MLNRIDISEKLLRVAKSLQAGDGGESDHGWNSGEAYNGEEKKKNFHEMSSDYHAAAKVAENATENANDSAAHGRAAIAHLKAMEHIEPLVDGAKSLAHALFSQTNMPEGSFAHFIKKDGSPVKHDDITEIALHHMNNLINKRNKHSAAYRQHMDKWQR